MKESVTSSMATGTDSTPGVHLESLLSAAIEQSADAVVITDPDGVIDYVNESFLRLSGYEAEEVLGQNPRMFRSAEHEPGFFEELWQTILRGRTWRGQIVNIRKDGTSYRKELSIQPVVAGRGASTHFVGRLWDVTRDAELEAQLRQSQKMEAIGQLASGIAHEINTPTQYIGDNIQFFQESFGGLRTLIEMYDTLIETARAGKADSSLIDRIDKHKESIDLDFLIEEIPGAIDRTLEGNKRVAEVVRAMKEFAHPSAEEMTATDINRAILNTVSVSRNEWKYVADIDAQLDPELPMVPCVPGAFNQVILNLVVNAAHAIGEVVGEGVSKKGVITIATLIDGDWAEIRISDTGAGIPANIRERIYNPFFTTKEIGKGTGQGLAIVRSVVVETHRGMIDFESEEGKGTTFVIRLPLKQEEN